MPEKNPTTYSDNPTDAKISRVDKTEKSDIRGESGECKGRWRKRGEERVGSLRGTEYVG